MILRPIDESPTEQEMWLGLIAAVLGIRERRKVILKVDADTLTLPVTPWKYSVQTGQLNKVYDVLDTGEVLVFGNDKLKKLKFDCFFPATNHRYPFVVGDLLEPTACIELIEKWKSAKSPVRVIITDSPVNLMMAIMTFDYKERDGSRDIYYTLSFTEYRDLNVPAANNPREIDDLTNLRGRPDAEPSKYKDDDWCMDMSIDVAELKKRLTGTFAGFEDFRLDNDITRLDTPLDRFKEQILIY